MSRSVSLVLAAAMVLLTTIAWQTRLAAGPPPEAHPPSAGEQIFRYDTFGDEQLWTRVLRMHEAIATVSPATALKVGLKVDVEALPPEVIAALRADDVKLDD